MTTAMSLGLLFIAKMADNALSTVKTIMIQRNRSLLAGVAITLSSFLYFWITRILMAMEELNLPDDQAMALLKQRGPLDDVFKDFSKLETDYMETVRGAIESCAERKAVMEQKREAR